MLQAKLELASEWLMDRAQHQSSEYHYEDDVIEAAAGAVADDILDRFPKVTAVSVTVHKPSAPVAAFVADVSATVERRRTD